MIRRGTGQWVGWLGAALVATAGGACFLALASNIFAPGLPVIDIAIAKLASNPGFADDTLSGIEAAALEGDRDRAAREKDDLAQLVADSRAEAIRLLERYEAGEFDDTHLANAVLTSLMASGHEDVRERAMDATRRFEVERNAPRGGRVALDSVRRSPRASDIEAIAREDLRFMELLMELEDMAAGGRTTELKIAAINALARAEEPLVTDFLLQRLEWETDVAIRQALAQSLMMRPDAMAGERLAAILMTPTEASAVRRCAADALSQHGRVSQARAALIETIGADEPDPAIRLSIVTSLGAIGADPAVEDALIAAMTLDSCDSVRAAAAIALVCSPTARTREALQAVVASDAPPEVRGCAEQALAMIQAMLVESESPPHVPAGTIDRR